MDLNSSLIRYRRFGAFIVNMILGLLPVSVPSILMLGLGGTSLSKEIVLLVSLSLGVFQYVFFYTLGRARVIFFLDLA
jgi:hypothetical protein